MLQLREIATPVRPLRQSYADLLPPYPALSHARDVATSCRSTHTAHHTLQRV